MQKSKAQVGNIVRSAREARELSQTELAEEASISRQTVIAVESNQRNPTYEVFCRLVHALDISADLIVHPDRAPYTLEQEQFIRELLACNERVQKIVMTATLCLIRTLLHDEPEKQE